MNDLIRTINKFAYEILSYIVPGMVCLIALNDALAGVGAPLWTRPSTAFGVPVISSLSDWLIFGIASFISGICLTPLTYYLDVYFCRLICLDDWPIMVEEDLSVQREAFRARFNLTSKDIHRGKVLNWMFEELEILNPEKALEIRLKFSIDNMIRNLAGAALLTAILKFSACPCTLVWLCFLAISAALLILHSFRQLRLTGTDLKTAYSVAQDLKKSTEDGSK